METTCMAPMNSFSSPTVSAEQRKTACQALPIAAHEDALTAVFDAAGRLMATAGSIALVLEQQDHDQQLPHLLEIAAAAHRLALRLEQLAVMPEGDGELKELVFSLQEMARQMDATNPLRPTLTRAAELLGRLPG